MRLETAPIYYGQPLAAAYRGNFQQLSGLFPYDPYSPRSFRQRLARLDRRPGGQRTLLAEALTAYNQKLGAGPRTMANIARLADPHTCVVLTGQQPGIFTGPLYTIYKALGACRLATRLSKELARPVAPVFWVGEEDHDFEEICKTYLPGPVQRPLELGLSWRPDGKFPVGQIPLPGEIHQLIDRLAGNTDGAPAQVSAWLHRTAEVSATPGEWFGRLMAGLFDFAGLVLASPLLPRLRRLQTPVIRRVLEEPDLLLTALAAGQSRVLDLGFAPQVKVLPGQIHLFIYREGQRVALFREGKDFVSRNRNFRAAAGDLAARAQDSPEDFSPGVVVRPAAQDSIFPILAYVAGPGEIGYYALLKDVYTALGGEMPVIYPRPNLTLIEPRLAELLDDYSCHPRDIMTDPGTVAQKYLGATDPVGIDETFGTFRVRMAADLQQLLDTVEQIDPGLRVVGRRHIKIINRQLNSFRDKVHQRHRRAHRQALEDFAAMAGALLPLGQWQERVYNIFPYLPAGGPDLPERLARLPLLEQGEHCFVYL